MSPDTKHLFNDFPVPYQSLGANGKILHVNKNWMDALGYSQKQVFGKPFSAFLTLDAAGAFKKEFERFKRNGWVRGAEFTMVQVDGGEIIVQFDGYVEMDENNQFKRTHCIFRDVTEKRKLESTLRDNEQFSADIFNAIQDGISLLDKDLAILRVNALMEEMYADYMPIVGKKCYQVYQGRKTICPWCPSKLALADGNQHTAVVPYPNEEDPMGWIELTSYPLLGADGKITGVIEHVKDITERVQAEQKIKTLMDISRQASSETSLEDLLFLITDRIVEVIPLAEAASIFLYDEKRKVARVQAWAGLYGVDIKGIEFKVAGSQIGRIFRAKKPVLIKNVAEDPDFVLVDKPGTREIKSQIAMPLIYKKQVIGIIYADNLTKVDAFSQKNLDLLESIGNQLIGVIENARLLDQVRESEEQYHSVVDDSPGLINRFLPDGTITFVNKRYCGFFGKKSEELIGTNIQSTIHEEDRKSVMLSIASLTIKSPIKISENRNIRHDGEIRWLRWTDRALFDEKGKIISCQSFGEDITERKQAEEKLKISEERFRVFMENVPAFAYIKDSDLRHIYGNPASLSEKGVSSLDAYIGSRVKDFYPEKTARELEENDKQVLAEKCATRNEFITTLSDGKEHTFLDIKFPIQLPDGTAQIGGLAIDITEQKLAQETIIQERDKAQKYLDVAEVMIIALNGNGEITLVNQKGANILGYQIEDLTGKNWFNICLPAADRVQAKKVFDDFIGGGVGLGNQFEQTILTESGEERIVDWHSTPLWEWDDDDEKHRIGSLSSGEDITERRRVEQELEKYSNQLEEMVAERTKALEEAQEELVTKENLAMLGQLAGGMGHQLRNPLGVISNAVYLLKTILPRGNEKAEEYIDVISSEVLKSSKIISDLLTFAQVQATDVKQIAPIDLVHQVLKSNPSPGNVRVRIRISGSMPDISIDVQQIEQVLGNLITNAYQSIAEDGKVIISAHQKSGFIYFLVKDTGIGIRTEDLSQIFTPLFTTKARGIGLGLAISKRLAEANGGTIEVKSKKGQGSTFTLILPIDKMAKEE